MLIMRRIFIILTALFFLITSAVNTFAEEPAASPDFLLKAVEDPDIEEQLKGEAEELLSERPALPPILPPSSMTPEQIREFFSEPGDEEEFIILNFDNADIRDVLTTVSTITGENFILGSKVGGKITIHSSEKIPVDDVLSVFESVLEVNNLALVKSGDFYKVIQTATARQRPLEIFSDRDPDALPYGDRPVTQLIFLEHVPVKEVSAVLKPMLSKTGMLTPNPRLNMLIVNDLASNIRRLLTF
jgi:general secretion pathway protein D